MHYMTPHTEYAPAEPWGSMFTEGIDSDATGEEGALSAWHQGEETPTEADIERVVGLYDGEIAWFDSKFQELWQSLMERGLHDETVVLLMGDHGEQLGDHGGWLHQNLWQENLMVPTMLRVPGGEHMRRPDQIQTVDLTSTLPSLTGVEPLDHWQGRDLSPLLQPEGSIDPGSVLSGSGSSYALTRVDGWKLIFSLNSQDGSLYSLNEDPGETDDRFADEPELAEQMIVEMRTLYESSYTTGQALLE